MIYDVDDWVRTYSRNNRDYVTGQIIEHLGRVTKIYSREKYEVTVLLHNNYLDSQVYDSLELKEAVPSSQELARWQLATMKGYI